MKKIFAFILAGILVIGSCATVFAAPPAEAPSEVSVKQDGKAHNVYAFGTSLALVYADGSIDIFSIGPDGRVNVMMDGAVTENISNVSVPAGQRMRLALGNGSIIVRNVTAESGEAIKKQIDDAYAAGASSVELTSLTGVTAYRINEDGEIVNVDGVEVSINEPELFIYSIDGLAKLFEELLKELMAEDALRAAAEAEAAANARAKARGDYEVPAERPADASANVVDTPEAIDTPSSGSASGGTGSSSASPSGTASGSATPSTTAPSIP